MKWIFRYLRGTIDTRLEFGNGKALTGYVDADFAGDLDKRRSLTGYVFTLGDCAISWKSTLQATVALSSTEAEYMAITEAIKEAIWHTLFIFSIKPLMPLKSDILTPRRTKGLHEPSSQQESNELKVITKEGGDDETT